jgi:hypothetical protein
MSRIEKAEAREADEVRERMIESTPDKLVELASEVEVNAEEKDQELLIKLGEEMEYNPSNVESIARLVKGTVDEGLGERAQRALDESMQAEASHPPDEDRVPQH